MMMATKKDSASVVWYTLGDVEHDGRHYEPGDALPELSAEQLEALRAAGVVSQVAPVLDEAQAQG